MFPNCTKFFCALGPVERLPFAAQQLKRPVAGPTIEGYDVIMLKRAIALILALSFAVPICCCFGESSAMTNSGGEDCPSCRSHGAFPEEEPAPPNQGERDCDCGAKETLVSEGGTLFVPKPNGSALPDATFGVAPSAHYENHFCLPRLYQAPPPGVQLWVAYCVCHR